MIDERIALLK